LKESVTHHRLRLLGVLCLALTVLPAAGDNSARVDKLGHNLICMCGCEQVLLECNHYGCPYLTPEHRELTAAVDDGKSNEDILSAFVSEYGPTVLAAPPNSGFNRVAWLAPYCALAVGLFGAVLVVRNWKKRPAVVESKQATPAVNAELDRFREQASRETDL
jgi:cytochrome c-type biogenesis protein CcmH/NrfF